MSGVSGSNASPAMGVVTKLSTVMGVPGPLSVAGEATVTITKFRPEQLYGVVDMLNEAGVTVPPLIKTTPPVDVRTPKVSTVTVPATGAAIVPNWSDWVGVMIRLVSQLAGFGGQAGGQTGPMPPPIPAGAAIESGIITKSIGIDVSNI